MTRSSPSCRGTSVGVGGNTLGDLDREIICLNVAEILLLPEASSPTAPLLLMKILPSSNRRCGFLPRSLSSIESRVENRTGDKDDGDRGGVVGEGRRIGSMADPLVRCGMLRKVAAESVFRGTESASGLLTSLSMPRFET